MKRHIPNFITLLNLTTGVFGIINALEGDYEKTIFFVLIGGFFDFLDGFVARILNVQGELGKQLDSLADMVTFGVLPAIYLYRQTAHLPEWTGYLALMIAVFSAVRLARFNLDDSQSYGFKGLPTPANTILITTIFLMEVEFVQTSYFAVGITVLSCFLLVSPIPMMALKFETYAIRTNWSKYLLLSLSILGLIIHGFAFLPFIIPLYLLLSFVSALTPKNNSL